MTTPPVIFARLHLAGSAAADEIRIVVTAPGVVTTSATVQRQGPAAEAQAPILSPLVVVDSGRGSR